MKVGAIPQLVISTVILTILAKAGALGRDIAMAGSFGASASVDAYFLATVVGGLLWLVFLTTITAVFLPAYVQAKEGAHDESAQLASEAVRLYVMSGAVMFAATFFLAPEVVALTAYGESTEFIRLATSLIRIVAVGFIFTAYVGVQNALQQANHKYLWPLAAQPINHLITIAAIFVAAFYGDIRIAVAGAVLGWVIQVPIQRWQTRAFYPASLGIHIRKATVRRLTLLSAPVILAVFLDQANIYIGIAIAARFGEGAVSHLGYASRLTLFLGNLVSWVTAYFLFPRLAAHVARGNDDGTQRDLSAGAIIICGLTLPMVVVALLTGPEIIATIFGRGAFGEADVAATAAIFLPYLFGVIAIGMREMLNRVFFSYQKTVAPMVIGLIAALVNLGLSLWLSRIYGVPGIAMGATGAALIYLALQVAVMLSWRKGLLRRKLAARLLALLAAAIVGYAAGALTLPHLQGQAPFIRLVICGAVSGAAYLAAVIVIDRVFKAGIVQAVVELRGSNIPPDQEPMLDQPPI